MLAPFFFGALSHAAPPNIVLILVDDLGYGDLGSYGPRRFATPRPDQMAREGLRFTQFYAGSTVCGPSQPRPPDRAWPLPHPCHGASSRPYFSTLPNQQQADTAPTRCNPVFFRNIWGRTKR